MRIHLLEPYKSALILQAVNEGFVRSVPPDGLSIQRLRKYVTQETIAEALQLAVLYDDVSMVWVEAADIAEKHGLDYFTSNGLKELGIVEFIGVPDAILEQSRKRKITDIRDVWKREHPFLDMYQDFVLSQLSAKELPLHWSILRLLRAVRLGYSEAVPLILPSIPSEEQPFARAILSNDPLLIEKVDMVILSVVGELKLTFDHAIKDGCKIAGAAPQTVIPFDDTQATNSPALIWKIVFDSLLQQKIEFPAPTSLKEVLKLRNSNEVQLFRSFLFPFIDAVIEGDIDAIIRLRKETLSAARSFQRFPVVRKFGTYAGYTSLGLSVVEALMGAFGPSIMLGLVPIGLEKLAKRWEKVGAWLYMAQHFDNQSVIENKSESKIL